MVRVRDMHPARRHLAEDHARLERLYAELENALDSADLAVVQQAWTRFEKDLLGHLEAEERWLFPLMAADHAADVKELRLEHERLRHLVSEEGLAADLHTLRRETAQELLTELRAHGAHEDDTVYTWLESVPEPTKLQELLDALVRRAGGIVSG